MTKPTFALAALALLLAAAAPVEAHPGFGGGFVGTRLEGENYNTPDAACDPDFDAEHTQPVTPSAGQSNNGHAFLPHSGCGLNYNDVNFAARVTLFDEVRARVGGQSAAISVTVTVYVDGSAVASGSFTATNSQGFQTYSLTPSGATLQGVHDVRVAYTASPSFANLDIDYVDSFQV